MRLKAAGGRAIDLDRLREVSRGHSTGDDSNERKVLFLFRRECLREGPNGMRGVIYSMTSAGNASDNQFRLDLVTGEETRRGHREEYAPVTRDPLMVVDQ